MVLDLNEENTCKSSNRFHICVHIFLLTRIDLTDFFQSGQEEKSNNFLSCCSSQRINVLMCNVQRRPDFCFTASQDSSETRDTFLIVIQLLFQTCCSVCCKVKHYSWGQNHSLEERLWDHSCFYRDLIRATIVGEWGSSSEKFQHQRCQWVR